MKHTVRRVAALTIALTSTFVLALSPESFAGKDKKGGKSTGPDSVVLFIGNRMFPEFGDVVSARMKHRHPVGDTEFSFEVVKFLPHFSIIDSTKKIISFSDEPKNPAFRIKVYKGDAIADSTWAFYNMDVPHFSRTSSLWFRVLAFDYRGEVFRKEPPKEPEGIKGRKK